MSTAPATGRVPRRIGRPRWMDPRIIGGILLLAAAVVVGSRVIAASSQTAPVWSATRDLSAGTVLAQGDLVPAEVNLGGTGSQYLGVEVNPVGRSVGTPIRQGELVPGASLGDAPAGKVVVIPVPPEKFPPGVGHGSVVDLYLTRDPEGTAPPETTLLRAGLTVQSVVAPAAGGLSGAIANQYQIAVLVDGPTADELVRSLPLGEAVLVLVTG